VVPPILAARALLTRSDNAQSAGTDAPLDGIWLSDNGERNQRGLLPGEAGFSVQLPGEWMPGIVR
jgi:hypothetical protein